MQEIADAQGVNELLEQLAGQIRDDTDDMSNLALIGIKRRGDVIAERLGEILGVRDIGAIDITLYRDDLSETGPNATVGPTDIGFDVAGREIVLCDDVIMTGRSILAALREILDYGRPSRIRLAVMVARPEREIPIRADHAALFLEPEHDEKVDVRLAPTDEQDRISINSRG